MLEELKRLELGGAAMFFLVLNLGIFMGSAFLCWILGWLFKRKRLFDRWEPIRATELLAAFGSVVFNAAISVLGWFLWKKGAITLLPSSPARSVVDCLAMILLMDLGMYLFHRTAHNPRIFPLFHRFHHRHEATNPISLFVLHPVEVIGFGGLMIVFLAAYPMTVAGLTGFLTLNVLFGTVGHSGVEPLPPIMRRIPILKLIGTSTFHAEHHEHPGYNFGFYTLLWDKLFGTLDPAYEARFTGKR